MKIEVCSKDYAARSASPNWHVTLKMRRVKMIGKTQTSCSLVETLCSLDMPYVSSKMAVRRAVYMSELTACALPNLSKSSEVDLW